MLLRWLVRALSFGLGWLSLPPAARSAPPPDERLALTWEAPPTCPGAARVKALVTALLPPGAVGESTLVARARVSRGEGGRWLLHLTLGSGAAQDARELVGDSCQALVDSVAVILALQLNPAQGEQAAAGAGETPSAPAAQRPAEPARRVAAPRPAPERARLFQLALAGTADSAALPRLALGGRVELGLALGRWSLSASFSQWLNQEQSLASARQGRGHFGWRAAALQLCHGAWGGRVRVGPCLALEAGELSARSSEVRLPGQVRQPWLAALAGAACWAPLGSHLAFTSSLEAVVPLRRPSFVIEGLGEIHQPRAMGVRSTLGLASRF